MGRVAWIVQVGPECNPKYPYGRESEGDLTMESHVIEAEAEKEDTTWRYYMKCHVQGHEPRSAGTRALEAGKDKSTDSPHKLWREQGPADTLMSAHWN